MFTCVHVSAHLHVYMYVPVILALFSDCLLHTTLQMAYTYTSLAQHTAAGSITMLSQLSPVKAATCTCWAEELSGLFWPQGPSSADDDDDDCFDVVLFSARKQTHCARM